ncbi:SAM-dependent methyltransferase [Longibacter salinarum]|uniref:SAM-dependent methyltransferase n=1 Tax=Longibacter salinarum TaxID=1850348 RepID=A0A2A8D2W6_9BACT|nr:class I SAM-dependent methyltransferase [Longibacter salinarum]PEN15221.1 SAM-dependent methyltransferase [Longibacter salinarum]
MKTADRESSQPPFWDLRYDREDALFGREPSAFVMQHAGQIPTGAEVLELGAGEGRTLLALAQEREIRGTGVDFSKEAIATARRRATKADLDVSFDVLDVRDWTPDRSWDIVIVSFLQLLPEERRALFALVRTVLRRGGWVFGQWFRPEHLNGNYDRVGPNRLDRMVAVGELRRAFSAFDPLDVSAADVHLDEGRLHGFAATAHLIARHPS